MTFDGVGVRRGGLPIGAPSTHSVPNMSLAKHVHGRVEHVLRSNHCATEMSWGLEFWFYAFMNVYGHLCLFDCNVCAIWCIALF